MTSLLCGGFDRGAAAEHDQIRERDLLFAGVELGLNLLQRSKHFGELRRVVHFPVLLWSETNAGTIGTAALVTATEGGSGSPSGGNEFGGGEAAVEQLRFELGDVLLVDEFMIQVWQRVLPDEFFLRHFRAKITCQRPHVAMRELEPSLGEGVSELAWILQEALGDLVVDRVFTQRDVGGEHYRRM